MTFYTWLIPHPAPDLLLCSSYNTHDNTNKGGNILEKELRKNVCEKSSNNILKSVSANTTKPTVLEPCYEQVVSGSRITGENGVEAGAGAWGLDFVGTDMTLEPREIGHIKPMGGWRFHGVCISEIMRTKTKLEEYYYP